MLFIKALFFAVEKSSMKKYRLRLSMRSSKAKFVILLRSVGSCFINQVIPMSVFIQKLLPQPLGQKRYN